LNQVEVSYLFQADLYSFLVARLFAYSYLLTQAFTTVVMAEVFVVTIAISFKLVNIRYHLHLHQIKFVNLNPMLKTDSICSCFIVSFEFNSTSIAF